jgi:hypothetical protein
MSTKIKLGAKPVAFAPKPVTFPMPDGTEGVITIEFKYRTRREYGQFLDEVSSGTSRAAQVPAGEDVGRAEAAFSSGVDFDAEMLLGCVHAWDLTEDGKPKLDVCRELVDELTAGSTAILSAYRQIVTEGRLGN